MTMMNNHETGIETAFAALIEAAWQARQNAYAPYSGFAVGAALPTEDGAIYRGCNIENVSFGLTNCAERTAMFTAFADGKRNLVRMVVCADTPEPIAPCGACRQVMVELAPQMELLLINQAGKQIYTTVADMMPYSFHSFPQQETDKEGDM